MCRLFEWRQTNLALIRLFAPMYRLVCLYHPPKTQFSWAIGFFIFYLQRILRKVGGRLLPPLVELFLLGCLKTFERDGPRLRPWPRDNRRVGVCVFGFFIRPHRLYCVRLPTPLAGGTSVFSCSLTFLSRAIVVPGDLDLRRLLYWESISTSSHFFPACR